MKTLKKTWRLMAMAYDDLKLRERILIIVSCLLLIYAIMYIALLWGQHSDLNNIASQIKQLKAQVADYTTQHKDIESKIKNNPRGELQHKLISLEKQIMVLDNKFHIVIENVITKQQFSKSIQVMLSKKNDLQFIDFASVPPKLLSSPHIGLGNISRSQKIYQLGILLKFKGNYFATLNYLRRVEKLGLPFFWDSLDYKVDHYPQATVTIKIHALSEDEGFVRA